MNFQKGGGKKKRNNFCVKSKVAALFPKVQSIGFHVSVFWRFVSMVAQNIVKVGVSVIFVIGVLVVLGNKNRVNNWSAFWLKYLEASADSKLCLKNTVLCFTGGEMINIPLCLMDFCCCFGVVLGAKCGPLIDPTAYMSKRGLEGYIERESGGCYRWGVPRRNGEGKATIRIQNL